MIPILLDIKIFKIYTFGVFLVLAFFWSLFFIWRAIKLTSYKEEEIFDGVFVALFWGVFFSRLVYVVINFNNFGFDVLKFILVNGYPGLSAYGAIFGGAVALYFYFKSHRVDFLKVVDYFIPGLLVAIAIAKIGSFLGGVDVGTTTTWFISVMYSGYKGSRHIPALYESVLFFIGAYISHRVLLNIRRHRVPSGFAFYFFLFYFSLPNLFLDKLKQNHLYFGQFNINLIISAILAISLGGYFIYFFREELMAYVKNNRHPAKKTVKTETAKSGKKPHKKN